MDAAGSVFAEASYGRGVTMFELMNTLAIASVRLVVALPSFERSTRSSLLSNTANDFSASLSRARRRGRYGLMNDTKNQMNGIRRVAAAYQLGL